MQTIKNILLILMVIITTVSCSKSFLEINPKGKVIASKTTDYDLLLNNLDLININCDGHILMGDEITALDPYYTGSVYRTKQLYQWQGNVYNPDEDAKETLVPTKDLYIYNKIIGEVMESTGGSDIVKKSLQAEALTGRAWTNFMLVNFYGKPYNSTTSATDEAFPLILEADINNNDYRRATVKQIYDQIVSDLTTAIPNLTAVGVPHRIRAGKALAQGLLAKVYVFMGEFDKALPLLDESINNLPLSAVPTLLLDYNTAYPGEPTVPNDQQNLYGKSISNTFISSSNLTIWLTPQAAALYGATDVRRTKWFVTKTFANGLSLIRKSGGLIVHSGLRVPELYLLRAECKARLNDLNGAVSELEYFRARRMPAADAGVPATAAADKVSLIQFIMEERIREFPVTGFRWFDMRRLSVDPLFTVPTYQHTLYSDAGEVSQTFTLDTKDRWVFKIPPKILAENPNMSDNP
jgi:starch-binding outer membrane protein, SusD/RagB family